MRCLPLSAAVTVVIVCEGLASPATPFVPEPAPVSSPSANTPVVPRSPPEKPAISTFAAIVNRRLFTRSRRPAPKKELKVVADAPKPETFDIIGVMISPAGRMALLRTIATNEVVRAFEGQSVGGWEVSAIKPTQIVLRRGDDSEVIKMNDAPPPSVANKAPNVNNPSASGVTSSPANVLCAPAEPPPVSESANQNFQAIRGYGYSVPYSPAYPPRQAYPSWPAYMPSYGYYPRAYGYYPPTAPSPYYGYGETSADENTPELWILPSPVGRYATHWFGAFPLYGYAETSADADENTPELWILPSPVGRL
jgi:hypothetical protein